MTQGVACVIVQSGDHGIDSRIRVLYASDRCVQQLLGRDLLVSHELGKSERVVLFVVFHSRGTFDAKAQREDGGWANDSAAAIPDALEDSRFWLMVQTLMEIICIRIFFASSRLCVESLSGRQYPR